MPSARHRSVFGPLAVVAALLALPIAGCAGSLDPSQFPAGGDGTGGTSGGGTGGSNPCTGNLAGATIVTNDCAISGCHDTAGSTGPLGAGLDLTVDTGIGGRLVGVMSDGNTAYGSACGGNQTPYLTQGSNPATGLLIDKIQPNPPCGVQMPYVGSYLSQQQQTCLIQWATTLTTASQ